jgi:hypothetical protein
LYSNNDQNLNRFYYILWVILCLSVRISAYQYTSFGLLNYSLAIVLDYSIQAV